VLPLRINRISEIIVTKTRKWDKYITYATKAYNTSVHKGTKYMPHEFVFGRVARVPTSTLADDKSNESYSEYATALFNRISDAQASACKNPEHAKLRSKQYYDRKVNPQVFNKDDYVYLLKEPLKIKLNLQYKGSYKVLEILESNNVKLAISDKRTRIVHSDKLKICRPDRLSRHNPTSPSRKRFSLRHCWDQFPLPKGEQADYPDGKTTTRSVAFR